MGEEWAHSLFALLLAAAFASCWLTARQGCPAARSWLPSQPLPEQAPRDSHGYEAGHGGLEAVKDVAGGERHEVVHE